MFIIIRTPLNYEKGHNILKPKYLVQKLNLNQYFFLIYQVKVNMTMVKRFVNTCEFTCLSLAHVCRTMFQSRIIGNIVF